MDLAEGEICAGAAGDGSLAGVAGGVAAGGVRWRSLSSLVVVATLAMADFEFDLRMV